jgi:hypothetical protein
MVAHALLSREEQSNDCHQGNRDWKQGRMSEI